MHTDFLPLPACLFPLDPPATWCAAEHTEECRGEGHIRESSRPAITTPHFWRTAACILKCSSLLLAALSLCLSASAKEPISALAFDQNGMHLAIGRYRSVTLKTIDPLRNSRDYTLSGSTGKVSGLVFSPDNKYVAAADGTVGRAGQVLVWRMSDAALVARLTGAMDSLQGVDWSKDGKFIAAASYDHSVYLWGTKTWKLGNHAGIKPLRELKDHTDAVYSVSFSPDCTRLASAGGDRTVKIWDVQNGKRLTTLTESTAELYTVTYRSDGHELAAAGVDRIIRTWNPDTGAYIRSAFAHDGPVIHLAYSHDGSSLYSTGEDLAVKQWSANTLQEAHVYPKQPDWPQAFALSPDDMQIAVGCNDGSLHIYPVAHAQANSENRKRVNQKSKFYLSNYVSNHARSDMPVTAAYVSVAHGGSDTSVSRNNKLASAQAVSVPCAVEGELWDGSSSSNVASLSHYYRFHAQANQKLLIETNARRSGSPMDSYLQILDLQGKPVERAVLRALGQSEITLFDKDSSITTIRLLPFPGLQLNDYVQIGRELLRVGTLAKSVDDDTQFRAVHGQRQGYLGTTPEYHTIGTKVYRVSVNPAGSHFAPNGMPLTHIYYENDDGGALYGRDSCLDFVAPTDGDYIVRVSDSRDQQGKGFKYKLLIHEPHPDFSISINPQSITAPEGGGTVSTVDCDRLEGFEGPIHVELMDVGTGFRVTAADIEAGEIQANLLVIAKKGAIPSKYRIVATATINGTHVVHTLEPNDARRLIAGGAAAVNVTAATQIIQLVPGHEIHFDVSATRVKGFAGRIPIDVRNLPFGVRVTDFGLNGILINENETTRSVTLYCEPWVKAQSRQIFVVAGVEGGIGSAGEPLMLEVGRPAPR